VIRFSCPACERVVEVSDSDAGLSMMCPTCGKSLRVPGPAPAPAGAKAGSAATARPRLSAKDDPDKGMEAIEDCPECGKALQVPPGDVGRRVACPRCAHQFLARGTAGAARRVEPEAERRRDEEDKDERPRRGRRDDEEEDERPRRRKNRSVRSECEECEECGADLDDDGACPECDEKPRRRPSARQLREAHSKKTSAGICGILLGGFGVHKFVLGYTTPGVIMLLVSLLTFCIAFKLMWIIGIVEGIIYLTKTDEEFYRTYMAEQKEWF
jgi:TM2 domain-containing membrane protein YozV/DNA-directed RNA polymerase subunit RPC12/RpoP